MSAIFDSRKKGFTIVELLIVIAVIGILAAITMVAYSSVQNNAKSKEPQWGNAEKYQLNSLSTPIHPTIKMVGFLGKVRL